jgi:hypothetical protein
MDPYLEDPAEWPGVHHRLISDIQTALNRAIRPRYIAVVEGRVYLSDEPDQDRPLRVPDVQIRRADDGPPPVQSPVIVEPVIVRTVRRAKLREARVEILEAGSRSVVTVIEVLSPTNKRPGSTGRGSFLRKRREVLRSAANWVEIDLLRAGEPTFPRQGVPPCEYAVHVSPVGLRPNGKVWPIRLIDRLPTVSIPLRDPDPDAPLDLQAVLDAAYDAAGFDALVDYRADPVPPLPPDLADWSSRLLDGRGLR